MSSSRIFVVFPGFLLLLALLKTELAVVHKLAYRRYGLRGDFHQVQPALLSNMQCLVRGHDTQLLAGVADQADLLIADLVVQLMHDLANSESTSIQNKNANAHSIRATTKAHSEPFSRC